MIKPRKYFSGGTVPDPVFKNQAEHDAYYRKQLLERARVEKPNVYGAYMGEPTADGSASTNIKGDLDTVLAVMGGIPKFGLPAKALPPTNPTNWSKLGFNPEKVEGFRYSKNRPDVASITNKRSFAHGGSHSYDPYETEYTRGLSLHDNLNGRAETTREPFDYKEGLNNVMPYLSNVANSFSRLPNPIAPLLEQTTNPSLVNYDNDRAELDKTFRGMSKGLTQSSPNVGVANANRVAMLSKVLDAKGKISQQEGNTNAQITNQNNFLNTTVNARNAERTNNFSDELTARRIKQQQLNQANLSDASNKFQLNQRDNKMMDMEDRKNAILLATDETGSFNRKLYDNYVKELYNKKKFGPKKK